MFQNNNIKNYLLKSNEMLFPIYIWGFTILSPITHAFQQYSKFILAIFAIGVVFLSFLSLIIFNKKLPIKPIVLIIAVTLIIIIDFLIYLTSYNFMIFYNFTIYGIIPVFLLIQIRDWSLTFNCLYIIAIIVFSLFFWRPFFNNKMIGDYMQFGFQVVLPVFLIFDLYRKKYKNWWLILLEIICFLEIVIFANRSCLLAVVFYYFLYDLVFIKNIAKFFIKWCTIIIGGLLILTQLEFILIKVSDLLTRLNIDSYAIRKYLVIIENGGIENFFSGRIEIWSAAWQLFLKNFLFGTGVSCFQVNNGYAHNIFLDIAVQFGIFGVIVFFIILIKSIINNFNRNNTQTIKLISIFFCCLAFPKLLFSESFYNEFSLWCFLAMGFFIGEYRNIKNENINKLL